MKRRMMAVLLTLCMVLSMFPAVTFAAGTGFDDMDGHWAETIVETWAGRGVVSGVGDNKFAPDKTLSRAELAQVIANLLKLVPSKNAPKFDDVDAGAWYSTAVGACAEEDIVSGIGGNKFGPALTATREQCMTIFCKVFGIEPLEDTSVLNQFADKDSVSNWAKGYVAALVKAGFVSGTKTGIAGDSPINRASVLALMNNVVGVYIDEAGEYDLKGKEVKGLVLVVCDDVDIVNAAEGTMIVTGPNAGNVTVNGEAVKADTTFVVKKEETVSGGGGSSRPSRPSEPEHECTFGEWEPNNDGTHSRACECGETETADCVLGDVYTSDGEGNHTRECEICGYIEEEACEYSWDKCVKCEYADGDFHISTVEELTSFAAIVNNGNDFTGETVVLEDDIDLADVEWTPIGNTANKFNGTFDGQDNTISNLTCEGTEFVGLFGRIWTGAVIKNVAMEDVVLSGNHFVGAVVAHSYGDVIDCSVDGFEIVVTTNNVAAEGEEPAYDNGDKVGGIAGWASCGEITGCSVSDGTIAAYRDAGGILGASINDGSYTDVTECSVSDVTITIDQTENGYGYKTPNAAAIVGRVGGTEADNSEENVTIDITLAPLPGEDGEEPKPVIADVNGTPYTDLREATDAATAGQTVVMFDDATVQGGTGGYGVAGLVLKPGATIDGQGNVLTVENANGTWNCAVYTNGGTIKNLTIGGAFRGIFTSGLTEALYVDNCVIDNVCYTFNADDGLDKPVEFTNCTINGWTSYSGTSKVTFENCSLGKGTGGYQYANLVPYTETYILNSEFSEGYSLYSGYTDKIYLYECTVGGVKVTQENLVELLGEGAENAHVLTVEYGVIYSDGGTVLYGLTAEFDADELVVPAGVKEIGDQALKNSSVSKVVLNEGLEVIGYQAFSKTANLTSIEIPSTVTTIGEAAFRQSGIEELTIPVTVTTIEAGAFRDMANLTTVTVEGNAVIPNYAWRSCPNLENVFMLGENVTFAGTSQVATHSDNGNATGITFYVANQAVADALAEAQDSAYGYTVKIVEEVVAEGVLKTGERSYDVVGKAGLMNINEALSELSHGEGRGQIVNLCTDVDMDGEIWTPLNYMWLTFNGNGHTISNLDCATDGYVGRSGFYAYGGGVTINDLTLENVTSCGTQAGLFAGSAEGLKLNRCVLKGDNSVTWKQNPEGSEYFESWNGIGVISGVAANITLNDVEIADGATVVVDYNGMTTATGCKFVDVYTGFINAATGSVTDNGEVELKNEFSYAFENTQTLESALGSIENTQGTAVLDVEDAELTWETGSEHGSAPMVSEEAEVEEVVFDGGENGATLTATGDGVGPIRAANGATLIFKNMTIVDESESYDESSWEFGYLEFDGKLKFENVIFMDPIQLEDGAKAEFVNCTFTGQESMYGAWVCGGTVTFTECTFTEYRGLKVHEDYGTEVDKVVVDTCLFDHLSKKPGIALGDLNADTEIVIQNSIFDHCQPGDQELYMYETDTDITTFTFEAVENEIINE